MRFLFAWALLVALAACDDDDLYEACAVPEDCEPPEGTTAACVAKEGGGFCSWLCTTDAECDREEDDIVYICSPFEQNPSSYCFPSCEGGQACPPDFGCRSTGGGTENRQICFPLE